MSLVSYYLYYDICKGSYCKKINPSRLKNSALKTSSYPRKEADWFSVTHEIGRVDPPFITEPIDQVISKNQPAPTLRLLNFSILWYEIWMLCNVSIYLSLLASQTWREWYQVDSKNSLLAWGGADWFPCKNFWIGAHGHFRDFTDTNFEGGTDCFL